MTCTPDVTVALVFVGLFCVATLVGLVVTRLESAELRRCVWCGRWPHV